MGHFALCVCVCVCVCVTITLLLGCLAAKPNREMEALVCAAKDNGKQIKLRLLSSLPLGILFLINGRRVGHFYTRKVEKS